MFRIYEVDPDADVLLIVPTSTTPFAQWHAGENGTSAPSGTGPTGVPLTPTTAPPAELRIKVSSKHLSLASRNFRDQFKWKWPSTKNSQPDGRFHLRLEKFDAKAVTVVMDALHGRGSRVPRSVDLETLAKIAMFVDEFQCYEAVEVYAERWIGQLERSLPSRYNRDAVLWIHIAYVFHRPDLFKAITRLVILQSTGRLSDLGLPLREKISRTIDGRRQELIQQGLDILHTVLDELRDGNVSCVYDCDSLLLGSITKTLHRRKLATIQPSKPYPGINVESIIDAIGGIKETEESINSTKARVGTRKRKSSWLGDKHPAPLPTPETSPEPERWDSFETHDCATKRLITPALDSLETGVDGLELVGSLGYYLY